MRERTPHPRPWFRLAVSSVLEREDPRDRPLRVQSPTKSRRARVPKHPRLGLPLPRNPCSAPQRQCPSGTPWGKASHRARVRLWLSPRLPRALRPSAAIGSRGRGADFKPAPGGGDWRRLVESGRERGVESRGERVAGCSEHLDAVSPESHAEELVSSLRCSRDFGREGRICAQVKLRFHGPYVLVCAYACVYLYVPNRAAPERAGWLLSA